MVVSVPKSPDQNSADTMESRRSPANQSASKPPRDEALAVPPAGPSSTSAGPISNDGEDTSRVKMQFPQIRLFHKPMRSQAGNHGRERRVHLKESAQASPGHWEKPSTGTANSPSQLEIGEQRPQKRSSLDADPTLKQESSMTHSPNSSPRGDSSQTHLDQCEVREMQTRIDVDDVVANVADCLQENTLQQDRPPAGSSETSSSYEPPELQRQRQQLAHRIADEARERNVQQEPLSEEGRKVFRAAGMQDTLATKGSIDVDTRWLKPVIQERIIPTEHTEVTPVIDREIHKYHIFPKILPVSDTDPIVLEPRHRIFSTTDGKWHEVVGDAAAIEILGKEAFRSGEKEVRDIRGHALPGFGEVTELSERDKAEAGLVGRTARVLQREGVKGEMGEWREVAREESGRPLRITNVSDSDAEPDLGPERQHYGD